MCGRFAQVIKHEQLKKLLDELDIKNRDEQLEMNYNVAPTQAVSAIINKAGANIVSHFRWGLIPSWTAEAPKYQLINVRSESILEKPSFKSGLMRRRCLIPMNGFYEWRKPDKQPFFIHGKDSDLLYVAGIYDTWTGADGSYVPSLAIITTAANETMGILHDRMPVLLTHLDFATWLNQSFSDPYSLKALLSPAANDFIDYYPVSKAVNKVSEKSERCMQREVSSALQ